MSIYTFVSGPLSGTSFIIETSTGKSKWVENEGWTLVFVKSIVREDRT